MSGPLLCFPAVIKTTTISIRKHTKSLADRVTILVFSLMEQEEKKTHAGNETDFRSMVIFSHKAVKKETAGIFPS